MVMWLPRWPSVEVAAGLLLRQLTIWDSFFLIGTHSDAHVPQMSQCHKLPSKVTPSCCGAIYWATEGRLKLSSWARESSYIPDCVGIFVLTRLCSQPALR